MARRLPPSVAWLGCVGWWQDGELILQASKDCVQKTIKRLEEKVTGRVLNHLLYLLRTSQDDAMKQRICTALAHLCNEEDRRAIFAGVGPGAALEVLLDMLTAPASTNTQQKEAAHALTALVRTTRMKKKSSQTNLCG